MVAGGTVDVRARLSPWQAILLAFGLMILGVIGWFYGQTREAQRLFLQDAEQHARLLADVVALHAQGALLAQQESDRLLSGFLGSMAHFVDYLDGIAPFGDGELAAFAEEAGLAVISVIRPEGSNQGGAGRLPELPSICPQAGFLEPKPDAHLTLYGVPRSAGGGCIWVGVESVGFERLQEVVGLAQALRSVAALPGVRRVALERADTEGRGEAVTIAQAPDGGLVAKVPIPSGQVLMLKLNGEPLQHIHQRQWRNFTLFTLVLAVAGVVSSGLLYRYQQRHLEQVRLFERDLSRQREEAALGRAAAGVAHEIRNPLNAIGMGLQRLEIEALELSDEHRYLLTVIRQALERGNRSVSELLEYARPCRPSVVEVSIGNLLLEMLTLYRTSFDSTGVSVTADVGVDQPIKGDPDLLRRVMDNLLRNALEAQPQGGFLRIRLAKEDEGVRLTFENGGFALTAAEASRVLEPWYTTKANGTGLGLSLSRRFVNAHGGTLDIASPTPGVVTVALFLPFRPPADLLLPPNPA